MDGDETSHTCSKRSSLWAGENPGAVCILGACASALTAVCWCLLPYPLNNGHHEQDQVYPGIGREPLWVCWLSGDSRRCSGSWELYSQSAVALQMDLP